MRNENKEGIYYSPREKELIFLRTEHGKKLMILQGIINETLEKVHDLNFAFLGVKSTKKESKVIRVFHFLSHSPLSEYL